MQLTYQQALMNRLSENLPRSITAFISAGKSRYIAHFDQRDCSWETSVLEATVPETDTVYLVK